MKFSIIVPIYNVAKYLPYCIDSILSQRFSDFELLLCDDGSSDGSSQICDEYAERDLRVKPIHSVNGGPSSARNHGLKVAKGDYVTFVDGDDCMCENVLNFIYEVINTHNSPDLVIGSYNQWDGTEIIKYIDYSKYESFQADLSIMELTEKFAKDDFQLPWRVYQAVIKRDLITKNNIYFDENTISAEDLDFYLRMIRCVTTYRMVNHPFVNYRIARQGSIVNTPSFKSVYGDLTFFSKSYKESGDFPHPPIMRQYFADEFTDRVMKVAYLKGEEKSKTLALISRNKAILNDTHNFAKFRIAKLFWLFGGFDFGSKILLFIWQKIK